MLNNSVLQAVAGGLFVVVVLLGFFLLLLVPILIWRGHLRKRG